MFGGGSDFAVVGVVEAAVEIDVDVAGDKAGNNDGEAAVAGGDVRKRQRASRGAALAGVDG